MTDQEINIAIAECCGWTTPPYDCTKLPKHKWQNKNDGCCYDDCPNYTTDLNAMHEAEKVLTPDQCEFYHLKLGNMTNRSWHATASQRAEAFLRILGKWKE